MSEDTKPTIEEMEATLNSGHQLDVEILPNGLISAKTDHVKTLKRLAIIADAKPSGKLVAIALRAVIEEIERLRAALEKHDEDCDFCGQPLSDAMCHRCYGKKDEEIERLTSPVIEIARKWSAYWKKLAQFRGWPASEHEKTRQENKRLRAVLDANPHHRECLKVLAEEKARLDAALAERDRERYIREQVEQRCDPAGDTRELILTRDANMTLVAALTEADEENERLKTEAKLLRAAVGARGTNALEAVDRIMVGEKYKARLDAALALHQRGETEANAGTGSRYCSCGELWPCPTDKALEGKEAI